MLSAKPSGSGWPIGLLTVLVAPLLLAGCGGMTVSAAPPLQGQAKPVYTSAPQPGQTLAAGTTDAVLLAGATWGQFSSTQKAAVCGDWKVDPEAIRVNIIMSYQDLPAPTFSPMELWLAFEDVLRASCGVAATASSAWVPYNDIDGDSSVVAFQPTPTSIAVRFDDGSEYLYTQDSAGADNIAEMQRLARSGDGLNSFIMTQVKFDYAAKS